MRTLTNSARPVSIVFASVGLAFAIGLASPTQTEAQDLERGQAVYDRWCAACHGFEGDGEGPAASYMIPRPRDFTRGVYQIRTTPGGEIPTDDDIMRVINEGMPGTTMPGWQDQLSRGDREALVGYLKSFYAPFETLPAPEVLDFGRAPRVNEERLEVGRRFYEEIECWQCHGDEGRGDGSSAPELENDWGNPLRAADLTQNWRFNGGGSVADIYQRLRTGMDGSPMPSFSDLIDAGFMTDDDMWSLAHYVRSLSPDRAPEIRDVIRAERLEADEMPAGLDDDLWDGVDSFYVPLVSQVIAPPRWFGSSVTTVWVQAVHDGNEVVFRLSWNDRSQSPDPNWMEWQQRFLPIMEPREGNPVEPGPRPDRFAVQFPETIPDGMERPYFLMGNARNPVYLWQWQSDQPGIVEATARGIHDIQPLNAADVRAEARWQDGQWQLLLRRTLATEDPTDRLQFEVGESIPIAFFAWDGDNGEEATRGSISSWFFVHLERETPPSTYIAPFVALLLTGGLGLFVVARAQRREEEGSLGTTGEAAPSASGA